MSGDTGVKNYYYPLSSVRGTPDARQWVDPAPERVMVDDTFRRHHLSPRLGPSRRVPRILSSWTICSHLGGRSVPNDGS